MENILGQYAVGILGIAVSIGLFLFGYRQTIGAKKERIRSANDDIEKILVRRIVLENFIPQVEELRRLIGTKARDFRARPADMLSESQLIENIFTRIVESDFIPREQREDVLGRLAPAIEEAEKEPLGEQSLDEVLSRDASQRTASWALGVLAVVASSTGAVFVALPKIGGIDAKLSEALPAVIVAGTISLVIIGFIIVLYRIRERQQEGPSKSTAISESVKFEREVFKACRRAGLAPTQIILGGSKDRGYDFIIEPKGRKVLIEVKAWTARIGFHFSALIAKSVDKLRDAVNSENASEAILVIRDKGLFAFDPREDNRVKIMDLQEFRIYLRRGSD